MSVPVGDIFAHSIKALTGVYVMGLAGVVLYKRGVLTRRLMASLSTTLFNYFFPCLTFVGTLSAVSLERVGDLWVVVVAPLVFMLGNLVVGLLGVLAVRPDPQFVRIFCAMSVFSNAGDVPIAMVTSFGKSSVFEPPAGSEFVGEEGEERVLRGIGYVSLYIIIWTCIAWTLLWQMLDIHGQDAQSEATVHVLQTQNSPTTSDEEEQRVQMVAPKRQSRLVWAIKRMMKTPPLVATLVSLVLSLIPPVRDLFIGETADEEPPLAFVMRLASTIGAAAVPVSMVILGASLAAGVESKQARVQDSQEVGSVQSELGQGLQPTNGVDVVPRSTLYGALVCRLLGGTLVAYLADLTLVRAGVLDADDALLRFVMLVSNVTPSATTVVIQTQLRNAFAEEVSFIVFSQYIVSLVLLPLTVSLCLWVATDT